MKTIWFVIAILLLSPLHTVHAASEYASFSSFYKEGLDFSPWSVLILAALIVGGTIAILTAGVTTGGLGAPAPAIAIGTWIGKLMGYSGAVATNVGLAFLGGGSIVSGGFGMAGGAALINAALIFSTTVMYDYALPGVISEYNYNRLTEQSANMPTLPLPLNTNGSSAYRAALEVLSATNHSESYFTEENRSVIRKAVRMIEGGAIYGAEEPADVARDMTLLSMLYFISNDSYLNQARAYAEQAIWNAKVSDTKHTLPSFILAASSAYDEDFDFQSTTQDHFKYSILGEPDNPLIPLLFSIYLDRIALRFEGDFLDETALDAVYEIMKEPAIREFRLLHFQMIVKRYFVQLKLNQQKISSLTRTTNPKLLDSPLTLFVVESSLITYRDLLDSVSDVLVALSQLDEASDPETRIQIVTDHSLLQRYISDERRLNGLVTTLQRRHSDIATDTRLSSPRGDVPAPEQLPESIGADELWYGYDSDKRRYRDRAIAVLGVVSSISDTSLYLDVQGKNRINCDTGESLSGFTIGQFVLCKGVVEIRMLGTVWIDDAIVEALDFRWLPITAEELWDGYKANKHRFRGKPLAVSGVVSEVTKSFLYLDVRGKDGISCDAGDGSPVVGIGDLVTCYGLVDMKLLGTVMMDNSRIDVTKR